MLRPNFNWQNLLSLHFVAALCSLVGCDQFSGPPPQVIQHSHPATPHMVQATEYVLPADELPADVNAALDPWISQLRGKQPADVKKMLVERWSTIQNPVLQELRDRLLEFQPTSVVVRQGQGWLRLQTPSADPGIGDSWYVPAPISVATLSEKLKKVGLRDNAVLTEFAEHFSGLRESMPDTAGSFLEGSEWYTFPLPGYELHEIRGAKDWQGSLILFHALNGNAVLLHPDGHCGWWHFPDHETEQRYPDLESFIRAFTQFSRVYSWPFDGYTPPDDSRRLP
ncbi:hypothetical protein NA78x_001324 [Anatilimnocola sp. NA78]|uniref:hypothetical protein n=1 Tax=Anatilimnocola sp. NA78 TaxID=3415683 RepID=UPI003CE5617D